MKMSSSYLQTFDNNFIKNTLKIYDIYLLTETFFSMKMIFCTIPCETLKK